MLETARPYGISKALSEVLTRTREHLEANERAEVARHDAGAARPVRSRASRSSRRASACPSEDSRLYLERRDQPVGVADDPDAAAVRPIREDEGPAHGRLELTCPADADHLRADPGSRRQRLVLAPCHAALDAAGGTKPSRSTLPADDDSADLTTYADTVYAAVADVPGPRRFWSPNRWARSPQPIVAGRCRPPDGVGQPDGAHAGESPGQWWAATGQEQACSTTFGESA